MRKNFIKILSLCASVLFCLLFVANKSTASNAALDGMVLAATVVIPAVFPFLAAANFISSLTVNIKSRTLNFIANLFFRLPGVALVSIVMGFLAGYPEGVRGASHLYESGKISQKQAEAIACFAVCAGPAFIIKAVGSSMLGSTRVGTLLFVAHFSSALLLAIILPRIFLKNASKTHETSPPNPQISNKTPKNIADIFCESVASASRAMLAIVGFITFFSVLTAIIQTYSNGFIYSAAPMVLEVTNGARFATENHPSLPLISAILAFGSLSVIFQLLTFGRKIKINPLKFTVARLLHAALAAAIIIPLERAFPVVAPVWAAGQRGELHLPGVPIPAVIALIFMAITLLVSFKFKKPQET